MPTFSFRVVVVEEIDDEGAERLYDAGCDDGVPESGPEGHSIGFDRESATLQKAVLSAIDNVEKAGFETLRIEPDELVSASDIAERTNRSRQSISFLITGDRGPGNWPRPIAGNVRSPLWRWSDVAGWFAEFDGSQSINETEARFLAAVNEILAARRALRPIDKKTRTQLLRRLASTSAA